jgi:hypothetical protein
MKKTLLGIGPIIATIIAIVMNFNIMLQGNSAAPKNSIVTLCFVIIWAFPLVYTVKRHERNLILPSLVFWGLCLITAIVTIMVNVFDLAIDFLIPFVIVFLTPLCGVKIGLSTISALIIIALISIFYIAYCVYGFFSLRKKGELRNTNSEQNENGSFSP